MNHFDIPVFNYFPWYRYPDHFDRPICDRNLYEIYRDAIPRKYNILTSPWVESSVYQNQNIDIFYSLLDKNYNTIFIRINDKEGWIKLGDNGFRFTAENWEELVSKRLMVSLGLKKEAQEYISIINEIDMLTNEYIDYYNVILSDNGFKSKFTITNFNELKDMSKGLEFSNQYIINYIDNYIGDVDFFNSLKSYYKNKRYLTPKQINCIKNSITEEFYTLNENKICIKIENSKYEHKDVLKEADSLIFRLSKIGYETIVSDNDIIIYKE